jgi:hypothetical protein
VAVNSPERLKGGFKQCMQRPAPINPEVQPPLLSGPRNGFWNQDLFIQRFSYEFCLVLINGIV